MPTTPSSCVNIQGSLDWCPGTPAYSGILSRIYYITKADIVQWPTLPKAANGAVTSPVYSGDFTLAADKKWKYIDVLPDKCQLTSEAQGEAPSQTQLNKLTAVHPGIGVQATAAAAYLNNKDNVFLVADKTGRYRVVGSPNWTVKTSVAQDLGQGPSGTTSTTISVEATDECPAPFYGGTIDTDAGEVTGTTPEALV